MEFLNTLENESIHIIREVYSTFNKPVLLYSVGKDSAVLLKLIQKAFYPSKVPFPLMHIDTGLKFEEMITFRDSFCKDQNLDLIIERPEETFDPKEVGCDFCCSKMKTKTLLDSISKHGFDCCFGGARRDEEKSRAKERIFSFRDKEGQWNPKKQRPELWDLYNTFISNTETVRIFPLSNWTEIDVWDYIKRENIQLPDLYFAKDGERYRSLGCSPCTNSIKSNAASIDDIIEELNNTETSERSTRVIDLTSDSSMEQKKKEGYF